MGESMGKGGKKHTQRAARAMARETAAKGNELFAAGKPVFSRLGNQFANFLSGDFDVTQSPLWAPGKLAAEQAYGSAQQNILSNMPAGGALLDELGDVERAKANTLTNLSGQVGQDMFGKAMTYGMGMPQLGISAMTGSGANMANLAGSEAAANAQRTSAKLGKGGDLGLGVGEYLGGKDGGGDIPAIMGINPPRWPWEIGR